jgi:hypothetical protein
VLLCWTEDLGYGISSLGKWQSLQESMNRNAMRESAAPGTKCRRYEDREKVQVYRYTAPACISACCHLHAGRTRSRPGRYENCSQVCCRKPMQLLVGDRVCSACFLGTGCHNSRFNSESRRGGFRAALERIKNCWRPDRSVVHVEGQEVLLHERSTFGQRAHVSSVSLRSVQWQRNRC